MIAKIAVIGKPRTFTTKDTKEHKEEEKRDFANLLRAGEIR
jgi:hypothetical protein